jgi:hypothetical protein
MGTTHYLLAWVFALAAAAAQGVEVAGVAFETSAVVAVGEPALALNGAGLRRAFFFDVYAMGLYLPRRTSDPAQALALPGRKRVAIQMLRDVDAETFADALEKGLRANHGEAEMQSLEPRARQLREIVTAQGEIRTGMRVVLDLVPGTGTVVAIDGQVRGAPIPGEDFFRALLENWLGEHPVSTDLKRALLSAPRPPGE